jgi:2-oxoglutarate dehydrogenase E1 component
MYLARAVLEEVMMRGKGSEKTPIAPEIARQNERMGELLSSHNLLFFEELYEDYLNDPGAVDPKWRHYFEGFDTGAWQPPPAARNGGHGTGNGRVARVAAPAAPAWTQPAIASGPSAPARGTQTQLQTSDPQWDERITLLRNFQFFRNMTDESLAQIASIIREANFAPGEYICREGELGEAVFFLVSGTVKHQRQGRFVVDLGPGEIIGELSVLDSQPRTGDVIAETNVETLEIYGPEFRQLLASNPDLVQGLLRVMVVRMREASDRQERVAGLIKAFREKGHALAKLNPLGEESNEPAHPELTFTHHGLTEADLDVRFSMHMGKVDMYQPLRRIIEHLKRIYCGSIGVQYMHIDDLHIQEWLRERMEDPQYHKPLSRDKQLRILEKLTDAELLETFLHRKFLGAKRFSLEGAESLIPLMHEAIEKSSEYEIHEIIIGMAHRGRLNVLANILQKPMSQIFREFEDIDPQLHTGGGDVKYHMGHSHDHTTADGHNVHLSLCFNPSHLEAVGPVVLGRARAKQDRMGDKEHDHVMPIIIHGDAAFIGQGVVQEMFNMSELPGYKIGGTVHIIVNNQIGFTTGPDEARSSQYATDIARMLQIPVFHVNGEDPEAVDRVIQIAMDFRNTFHKDIVIDMYCYRRHGHNEGDEPAYTQPLLYKTISKRKSVREAYTANLLKLGGITQSEADQIAKESREKLEQELTKARSSEFKYRPAAAGKGVWSPYCGGADSAVPEPETGVPIEKLASLMRAQTRVPSGFTPHRKIERHMRTFEKMASGEVPLNWGAGELLAYATLLTEHTPIRISGQDSQRGTFSHRHAALRNVENG